MALQPGTRLGPYLIDAAIGAGGMGEVYRAKDTRLERTVAIKVMPEALASAPEFRGRFEREARAISALNHPNICTLYDVGTDGDRAYLVLEYLQGETLAQRLERGPLNPAEALQIAMQIADALDTAHRQGIVHRDLKPGNVMLLPALSASAPQACKLLDFGLAKATGSDRAALVDLHAAPTQTSPRLDPTAPLTTQGSIIGTFQYMAPEQIEGQEADARTDIWAFGCVLYEMLTGRRAFAGRSQASLIGAILKDEPPPVSSVQALAPRGLDRIVRTCLAKLPGDRFQNAHDVLLQLRWIAEGGDTPASGPGPSPMRVWGDRALWAVAGAAAALAVVALLPSPRSSAPEETAGPVEFSIRGWALRPNQFNLSPDGRMLVYGAAAPNGNEPVLWIRQLDSTDARPLPGTEGVQGGTPFWSPDSRKIAFRADGKLRRIDLGTGVRQTLCDLPTWGGGAWNREDVIVVSIDGRIHRLSANGGTPVAITTLDESKQEIAHYQPFFLPDGRHFMFHAASRDVEQRAEYLGSLDAAAVQRILPGSPPARYAPPGFLLTVVDGALLAQPFDSVHGQTTGEPRRVLDDAAVFVVSDAGAIAYRSLRTGGLSQLQWISRDGRSLGNVGPVGNYAQATLSPDDTRVALEAVLPGTSTRDVVVLDLASGASSRLTSGVIGTNPVWSADSQTIAYSQGDPNKATLMQRAIDGRDATSLFDPPEGRGYIEAWSSNRQSLIYLVLGRGLLLAEPAGGRAPTLLVPAPSDEPSISPDGRWVAYNAGGASNQWEVFVASFPDMKDRREISQGRGGGEPRWRADGRELFYLSLDGKVMSVTVTPGSPNSYGTPVTLFQSPLRLPTMQLDQYGVSRDGQRLLFLAPLQGPDPPLTVLTNWLARFK